MMTATTAKTKRANSKERAEQVRANCLSEAIRINPPREQTEVILNTAKQLERYILSGKTK
jgi:hypothetical protein